MVDERYTFEQARIRLEEIATEVRKKDTSLEKSLDLLEEGVRLANICTELVDHTDLSASAVVEVPDGAPQAAAEGSPAEAVEEAELEQSSGEVESGDAETSIDDEALAVEEPSDPADAE